MRNSSSIWDKTARVGDLCTCLISGKYCHGIVVDIYGFDYWRPQKKDDWIYIVWIGQIIYVKGNKVEKT